MGRFVSLKNSIVRATPHIALFIKKDIHSIKSGIPFVGSARNAETIGNPSMYTHTSEILSIIPIFVSPVSKRDIPRLNVTDMTKRSEPMCAKVKHKKAMILFFIYFSERRDQTTSQRA